MAPSPPTLSDAFWRFAEVGAFWADFAPLSADGRAARDARALPADRAALEAAWDDVDAALALLAAHPERERGLAHHLARLPSLPHDGAARDATDLSLVNRFLAAHAALAALADDAARAHFGLAFALAPLLARLSLGHEDDAGFHLAEGHAPALAVARASLRAHDARTAAARRALLDELRAATGLDFRFRDFLLLPAADAVNLPAGRFALAPGDAAHLVVRPLLSAELLEAAAAREALLVAEKAAEDDVLAALTAEVRASRPALVAARAALVRFDLAFAKARLAQRHGLVRPELTPEGAPPSFLVEAGRHLPLEARCAARGARYWPLDLDLTAPVALVVGANMGGKTLALATVGFLQALAQLGFFVPARRLRTAFYRELTCVGGHRDEAGARIEGLSSFGLEVDQLVRALGALDERTPALWLVDELARTTGSSEAAALLSALVGALAARGDLTALLSTHVVDLALPPAGVACFRMAGLADGGLDRALADGRAASLAERVRRINDHMAFHLVPTAGLAPALEAIHIAEILGLDAQIVREARRHLGATP